MIVSFLRFKELLEARVKKPKPTFASVKPNEASIDELQYLSRKIGLKPEMMVHADEYHSTVCYSRKAIPNPTEIVQSFVPMTAVGDELAIFGTEKRVLVLKLQSVKLRAVYAEIMKTGASYDFPTFEPHVTLCYDLPEDFEVPKSIDPVRLRFTDFEVKPLDLDWEAT